MTLAWVQRRNILVPKYRMLWKRTLEDANSGGEVVNTAGGLEGGSEDLDGGNEIVSEAVVQVALFAKKYALVNCWIGADIGAAC
jgi:hypothetical protein